MDRPDRIDFQAESRFDDHRPLGDRALAVLDFARGTVAPSEAYNREFSLYNFARRYK